MSNFPEPLDLKQLKVYPLSQRQSMSQVQEILVEPSATPQACGATNAAIILDCARKIAAARQRKGPDFSVCDVDLPVRIS